MPTTAWTEVALGDEVFNVEVVSYGYEYMTSIQEGESPPFDHDQSMIL